MERAKLQQTPEPSAAPKKPRPPNETLLEGYVTNQYLERLFGRSKLTLTKWRKFHGMPYIRITGDERDTIRYKLEEVLKWAEASGRSIDDPTKPKPRLQILGED